MLQLRDATVTITPDDADPKTVLRDITLDFAPGKNYCLLGPNGSGKSSLSATLMGNPKFSLESGEILLDGEKISELPAHERAQHGLFLAFQNIPEIRGIKLFEFLRSIFSAKTGVEQTFLKFKKHIVPLMESLDIDPEFLRRDLNVGFSGGEKRKIEMLQLKLLEPRYIFLDEIDSGLDVDAFKTVAEFVRAIDSPQNSLIIITHYFSILDFVPVDEVFVLQSGQLAQSGQRDLATLVQQQWFGILGKK